MRTLTRGLVLVTLVLGAACADFDLQERIEDLRVLGVRTTPPEVQYGAAHVLFGPAARPSVFPTTNASLDVEVLAFDPRGGPMEVNVQLCPQGNGACQTFDAARFINNQPEVVRDDAELAFAPFERTFELSAGAENPAGLMPDLNFTLPLRAGAIDAIIPDSGGQPLPQFFPLTPRIGVDVTNTDIEKFNEDGSRAVNQEIAFKRVPLALNFGDPTLPPEIKGIFGEVFGVVFCETTLFDDTFEEGPAACYDPPPPNQNPALLGFQLVPEGEPLPAGLLEDEPIDIGPRDALLQAAPGGQIVINPVFAGGVRAKYQVLKFQIEESQLEVENRLEDLVVSYYSTRGDIADPERDLLFGTTLGQVWSLPQSAETGERDTLVAVVRDQRGGTTFATITVEYR